MMLLSKIYVSLERETFDNEIKRRFELKEQFKQQVTVLINKGEASGDASNNLNSTVDLLERMVLKYSSLPETNPFASFWKSVGFVFISITTIGWGNIYPLSWGGHVIHCILTPFGIIIVLSLLKKTYLFMNYLVKAMFDCNRNKVMVKPSVLMGELNKISVDTHLVESHLEKVLLRELISSNRLDETLFNETEFTCSSEERPLISFSDDLIWEIGSWYQNEDFVRNRLRTLRNSSKIRSLSLTNASILFAFSVFLFISWIWMEVLQQEKNVSFPNHENGLYPSTAFYFVFTTFSTIGFGEYSVDLDEKCIYHIFFIIVGMSSWTFLCGVMVIAFETMIDRGISLCVVETVDSSKSMMRLKMLEIKQELGANINLDAKSETWNTNLQRPVTMLKTDVFKETLSSAATICDNPSCTDCAQSKVCPKLLLKLKIIERTEQERVELANNLDKSFILDMGKSGVSEVLETLYLDSSSEDNMAHEIRPSLISDLNVTLTNRSQAGYPPRNLNWRLSMKNQLPSPNFDNQYCKHYGQTNITKRAKSVGYRRIQQKRLERINSQPTTKKVCCGEMVDKSINLKTGEAPGSNLSIQKSISQ